MNSDSSGLIVGLGILPLLIVIPLIVFMIVAAWKVFVKAGQPGWACLVPIYNAYVWIKIAGRPGWWLVLLLIPVVSFIISILLAIEISRAFGKGGGFAVLMILLPIIALPILAFGDATYTKPAGA